MKTVLRFTLLSLLVALVATVPVSFDSVDSFPTFTDIEALAQGGLCHGSCPAPPDGCTVTFSCVCDAGGCYPVCNYDC